MRTLTVTASLDIYLYGAKAAEIRRLAPLEYRLKYTEQWASARGAVPVSVLFPVRRTEYSGPKISYFLENLLPDRDDVKARWARDVGLDSTESFALIAAYGSDVTGALEFVPGGGDRAGDGVSRPVADAEIARRIVAVRSNDAQWGTGSGRRDNRFSLGGAQGKFALAYRGGHWFEPTGTAPSTHILKPGVHLLPDSDLTEHVLMTAATTLQLRAAATAMVRFGEEHALVVTRFDRVVEEAIITRLHQEDFAQATGTPTLRKYEQDGGTGYRDAIRIINDHVTPMDREQALWQFLQELMYSWIVVNNDGHAKNHSLQLFPGRTVLAPMYDVNSYLPYLDPAQIRARDTAIGEHVDLALALDGERRVGAITAGHWRAVARQAGIPGDALIAEGLRLAEGIMPAVNAAIDGLDERFQSSERLEYLRLALYARSLRVREVLTAE